MIERILHKDFSEEDVQRVINAICMHLRIPNMVIMPMSAEFAKKNNCVGMYFYKKYGFRYITELLDESCMMTAAHELCHHFQEMFYPESNFETSHGPSFTKAIRKVARAFKDTFGEESFPYQADILRRSGHSNTKCDRAWDIKVLKYNESVCCCK